MRPAAIPGLYKKVGRKRIAPTTTAIEVGSTNPRELDAGI